eukprot:scaffold27208_cov94-Isochrysis_galbana.AAC.1
MDSNIVVVRLAPGFDDSMLYSMVKETPDLHGMVLSLYGTGNGPASKRSFIDLIKVRQGGRGVAIDRGICVVISSQCLRGSVSLATYEVGRMLIELGVVAAGDMTTEAVVTKLGYLVGRGRKGEALNQAMATDLRGELTPEGYEREEAGQPDGPGRVARLSACALKQSSSKLKKKIPHAPHPTLKVRWGGTGVPLLHRTWTIISRGHGGCAPALGGLSFGPAHPRGTRRRP